MGLIGQNSQYTALYSPISKTYEAWADENPVIGLNIIAIDTTNQTIRVGNGSARFLELSYSLTRPAWTVGDVIGVEWDRQSSNPALRRIDIDGNTVDVGSPASYFDAHLIYGNMVRVRINSLGQVLETGNGRGDGISSLSNPGTHIMVRIPRAYFKHYRCDADGTVNPAGRYERYLVSSTPRSGFTLDPAFYARGRVSNPAEFLYVGAFTGIVDGDILSSRAGAASTVSETMQWFEDKARAVNPDLLGWGIMDIHQLSLLKKLFIIEFATWNSQLAVGYGRVGSSSQLATGSAAGLLGVNGTGGTTANQSSAMAWRGIENFWGNIHQFIIGVNGFTDKYRIINPDGSGTYAANLSSGTYIETTGITPIWYSNAQGGMLSGNASNGYSYGYIKDLLFTDQTKGLFIPSLLGGSDSTYIPDYLYSVNPTNQPTIWLHGGFWSRALYAGAFSVDLFDPVDRVGSGCGARLCFL
jgi:hypothetical protein